MDSDKDSKSVSFVSISEEDFERYSNGLPSWRTDWEQAKGRWICIRQWIGKEFLYRAFLAKDWPPLEDYKQSSNHSFIILE